MTSTRLGWVAGFAILASALGGGCSDQSPLDSGLPSPDSVLAVALNSSSIRVTWHIPQSADVLNFEVQRRTDLAGHFRTIATQRAASGATFLDSGLEAGTFYGYRIVTLNRLGDQSEPSTVAGALTAPLPGIKVITNIAGTASDPDGYRVSIEGAVDTTAAIGIAETRLFSPLPAGEYAVTLHDVLSTCSVDGDSVRTLTVTDQGLNTQQQALFSVSCLDPTRGRIVTLVDVTGDSVDADGYRVNYAGIIPGQSEPALGGTTLSGEGGVATFGSLRPGDYEVTLEDVEAPCSATGPTTRTVNVEALSADTVGFAVTCPDKGGSGGSGPLVWRNTFAPQSAAVGQSVTLDVVADMTGIPGQDLGVIQATVTYNPAILTYVSATVPPPAPLNNLTLNTSTPGTIGYLNLSTGTPPTGVVPLVRFTFQVKAGASGSTATRTTILVSAAGDGVTLLDSLFQVVEDTFTVGSGSGGSNQPPTAHANGPYSGIAGAAISFSSSGSSDPDGTIATYGWAFGDGGTSALANPTHSYAAAGSYTVTLTVTDDKGAQGTSQATVTVSGGGGGNQQPVAHANGPYSGTVGTPVTFSSAGSTDPDGTIASYAWDFGDGGSSTAQSPTHTYASAGTYTATLTVTDNLGATGSSQATVTVSGAGGSTPFTWTNAFGAFESVLGTYPLSITLNLSTDIPETTGPEALGSFTVDSIVWDPAVLEYHSLAFGSGGGSFNTTNATGGCKCKLLFNGSPTSNSGIVTIATVRFKPVGPPGASVTTVTGLGPILSTPGLGSFNYRNKIQVVEGTLVLP